MAPTPVSPLMAGLLDSRVTAKVKDLDHYRIHGGMAIETDYIISIKCYSGGNKTRPEPDFEPFTISKTFNSFRTLADQLHDSADKVMSKKGSDELPRKVKSLASYCAVVLQLVDTQRTQYLGKVNYMYVKVLAKQRSQILTDVLDATLSNFPDEIESHPFLAEVASIIEAFFLTDHCASADDEGDDDHITSLFVTPLKKNYSKADSKLSIAKPKQEDPNSPDSQDSGILDEKPASTPQLNRTVTSPVVPITRKQRRTQETRKNDERELNDTGTTATLLLDDDRSAQDLVPSYDAPVPSTSLGSSSLGTFIDNNPLIFMGIFAAAMQFLRYTGGMVVTVDLDILLLVAFACFCLGLHTPRPIVAGVDKPPLKQKRRAKRVVSGPGTPNNAAKLLRRSMNTSSPASNRNIDHHQQQQYQAMTLSAGSALMEEIEAEVEEGEDDLVVRSPMPRFPEGAPLGSLLNCWSDPPCTMFSVRGEKYLSDKKKIKSGPYLFRTRGIDLFLTDTCPENVGRISSIMGGELRDVPTFMINFRLPWGVLLFYYEIPERFVPFIKGCYKDSSITREELEGKMSAMNNQDRCCARFLLGNDVHKNNTLKIFPGVVEGPWVAKSVIGGKPAIIGTKLPVNYVYEPESIDKDGKKKALYLEADLDIVSSSAARGILSVTRTYTQDLTIDLGFAVQGNRPDELPEQMLTGTRLHGIDPLNAPPLPPMKDMMFSSYTDSPGDDDTERGDDD